MIVESDGLESKWFEVRGARFEVRVRSSRFEVKRLSECDSDGDAAAWRLAMEGCGWLPVVNASVSADGLRPRLVCCRAFGPYCKANAVLPEINRIIIYRDSGCARMTTVGKMTTVGVEWRLLGEWRIGSADCNAATKILAAPGVCEIPAVRCKNCVRKLRNVCNL